MAGDLVDRILGEIRERMRESRAAYDESQRLEEALAALGNGDGEAVPRSRAKPSRPQSNGRARRGANREAILAAVSDRPGSTAREIADVTGIARATVASTVTRLAANGVLERSALPDGGVGFRAA